MHTYDCGEWLYCLLVHSCLFEIPQAYALNLLLLKKNIPFLLLWSIYFFHFELKKNNVRQVPVNQTYTKWMQIEFYNMTFLFCIFFLHSCTSSRFKVYTMTIKQLLFFIRQWNKNEGKLAQEKCIDSHLG